MKYVQASAPQGRDTRQMRGETRDFQRFYCTINGRERQGKRLLLIGGLFSTTAIQRGETTTNRIKRQKEHPVYSHRAFFGVRRHRGHALQCCVGQARVSISCLTRPSQLPLDGCRHSRGIYAPTLRYYDGTFYLITTNISGGENFIVTAQDPAGPWSEPYWLGDAAQGIDPSLLFDDDGRCYYVGNRPNPAGEQYGGDWEIWAQELDLTTPAAEICVFRRARRLCGERRHGLLSQLQLLLLQKAELLGLQHQPRHRAGLYRLSLLRRVKSARSAREMKNEY